MIVTAMILSTFSSAALMISLMASSGPSAILTDLKEEDELDDDPCSTSCTSSLRGFNYRKRKAGRRLRVDEAVELDDYFSGSS
ncbi:MAG: hypothetical protein J3R72DRAFT_457726 [Linnemannia gamsii]|nr:MAG: hypothetical protein J3R72DRAFT_457726 [Linnemannia gamsii]